MAGWLMIGMLVGGMTWMFALVGYTVLMWAKNREEARAKRG